MAKQKTPKRSVFFISVANDKAYDNFLKTMVRPVKTAKLPGKSELKNFDELCVWGLQYYGHNQHLWPQIKNNDILFFYREKYYICTAIVEGKEDNLKIANHLWGKYESSLDQRGFLVYMLPSKVRFSEVPSAKINDLFGYIRNHWLIDTAQSFHPDDSRVRAVEEEYGSLEKALSKFGIKFSSTKKPNRTDDFIQSSSSRENIKKIGIQRREQEKYPMCYFLIDSNDSTKDAEILGGYLMDISTELSKNNTPYKMEIKSGSLEVVILILQEINNNPLVVAAIGAAVGVIMDRFLSNRKNILKINPNEKWCIGMALHHHVIIRRLQYQTTESIKWGGNVATIIFKDDKGKNYTYRVNSNTGRVEF